MKLKLFVLTIFFSISVQEVRAQVKVRFTNASKEEYTELYVHIGDEEFKFKNLKSGTSTDYVLVDSTYRYFHSWIKTEKNKDGIRFLPFDFDAEKLYTNGKLNIKIRISEVRTLEFEAVEE